MTTQRLDNVSDVYVLTPMQEGILYHSISEPSSGVFINQISTSIEGDLDVNAFGNAWSTLSARHSALRTAFLWDGLDEPLQVVREHAEPELTILDWSSDVAADQESQLHALLAERREKGFDVEAAPLFSNTIVKLGPAGWRWVFTFHHLIADGWSAQVLFGEFKVLYARFTHGQDPDFGPAPPFGDYVAWRSTLRQETSERHWSEYLRGYTHPLRLDVPGLQPGAMDSGYATQTVTVGRETTIRLKELASSLKVTLNSVVMAAWSVVLSRWTREQDIVFGVTMSGRPSELNAIERAVGLFINTLPIRLDVDAERPVVDLIRHVQAQSLTLHSHESDSLASIQRWSEVASGESLFEAIYVFENYPPSEQSDPPGLTLSDMRHIEQSNYPLAVLVLPGERLSITLIHDRAQLSSDAVASVGRQIKSALSSFTTSPQAQTSDVAVVDAEMRAQLESWGTGPESPHDERPVHQIIQAMARSTPEAVAVSGGHEKLSYADLDSAATRLAHHLDAIGVTPGDVVGVYLPRSPRMIVGILGVLYAGAAYVPLDPAYPDEHIGLILAEDDIGVVVTDRANRSRLPGSTRSVAFEETASTRGTSLPEVTSDHLAYVIHTSGSTGRPKGVMVTHSNLVSSTLARDRHYPGAPNTFLLLSSFSFDSSIAGIFWTLCSGGTVVVPPPRLEQDMDRLLKFAASERITHLLGLPALYQLMLEDADGGELDTLRVAIVAGESCPPSIVQEHRDRVPNAELHNEYGPTEATVWATVRRIDGLYESDVVPIGAPIAGARVHVLDSHLSPTPPGFPGELWVGGSGVAKGYLGQPALSRERFLDTKVNGVAERLYRTGDLVSFNRDGDLLFLGRADTQVKVRGHRIELSAVEARIRTLDGVADAVATTSRTSEDGNTRLIGYVVAVDDDVDGDSIRDALKASLPEFMVPDVVILLDSVPRLPNGKLDHGSLPDPRSLIADESDSYVAPRNESEAQLAAIWEDLLGVERVGVDDDYFTLGGDSIISIRMVSRARQAGIHLQPGDIVDHPTVGGLVAISKSRRSPAIDSEPRTGVFPLGPAQRWFASAGLENPDHWNQSRLFRLTDEVDSSYLEDALIACVEHHDLLRARYRHADGHLSQTVEPPSGFNLLINTGTSKGELDGLISAYQSSLNLEGDGPLKAIFIETLEGAKHLLVVVHHLVMDVVSWSILIDDIETAYRQRSEGDPISLPSRTASYAAWVESLSRMDTKEEMDYWRGQIRGPEVTGNWSTEYGFERDSRTLIVRLDTEHTESLLTSANAAYQTRPYELLLAALAVCLSEWLGTEDVGLTLEGHGRQTEFGLDVSRTIGWFTALFPLNLRVEDPADLPGTITSTKEQLRSLSYGGTGYGILKYLSSSPELGDSPLPPVLFNYLGADSPSEGVLLAPAWSIEDTSRAPINRRLHLIEVVAGVADGRLESRWHFSERVTAAAEIDAVAHSFIDALERVIDHSLAPGAGRFTPSDFPESGLDQTELDDFLESLG